ncbi:MAG: hypothetical protein ACI9HK_005160 [Pirellulaceae bacterium]|jgi:hypothetical protein
MEMRPLSGDWCLVRWCLGRTESGDCPLAHWLRASEGAHFHRQSSPISLSVASTPHASELGREVVSPADLFQLGNVWAREKYSRNVVERQSFGGKSLYLNGLRRD